MKSIPPKTGWRTGDYTVVAASAAAQSEWNAFAERNAAAAKTAYERLSSAPLERIPGRQFPLRGAALKGFWELEASAADRVYYAVHLTKQTVIIACRSDAHTGAKVGALIKSRRSAFEALSVPARQLAPLRARRRKKPEGGESG